MNFFFLNIVEYHLLLMNYVSKYNDYLNKKKITDLEIIVDHSKIILFY